MNVNYAEMSPRDAAEIRRIRARWAEDMDTDVNALPLSAEIIQDEDEDEDEDPEDHSAEFARDRALGLLGPDEPIVSTPKAAPKPKGPVNVEPHAVAEPAKFILAGNAYFTLRSAKTGTRYTYRVSKAKVNDEYPGDSPWFVSYLTGSDNTADYQYLGMIGTRDLAFRLTKASRLNAGSKPVIAFAWTWERLGAGRPTDGVEIWHESRCGRCGRKLTVPESIETGFGPECAGKL